MSGANNRVRTLKVCVAAESLLYGYLYMRGGKCSGCIKGRNSNTPGRNVNGRSFEQPNVSVEPGTRVPARNIGGRVQPNCQNLIRADPYEGR